MKNNIQRGNKAAAISIRQTTHTMMDATKHRRVRMLRANLAPLGMSASRNRFRIQQMCTSSHRALGTTNTRINRPANREIILAVRTTTRIQIRAGGINLSLSLRYSC